MIKVYIGPGKLPIGSLRKFHLLELENGDVLLRNSTFYGSQLAHNAISFSGIPPFRANGPIFFCHNGTWST